LRKSNFLYTAF